MLISLFERAYLVAYRTRMRKTEARRWNSWDDYMHEWCRRDDFLNALPLLLRGEDPGFQAYIRKVADAERAALDQLTADPCEWVRNEAKCALDELSDPLRDQDAEHDGAEDFEPELRTFEARGVTIEDHGRLNYIRANSAGAIRDRAGALLVKLAGVMK
jgi:hypothetical protein